jgi:hypothetical protein
VSRKRATFKSYLSSLLFENFWLKMIAVVFALGFYAFIHSQTDAQRTVAVKLVVEKPPENVPKRLMTDIPPAVDVTLIGPLQQLEALRSEDLSITLNLSAAQDTQLRLTADMINDLPPRVQVDRIYPSRLNIEFQNIVTREVRVQVARAGEPAPGFEVQGRVEIDPELVTATGIESMVTTLQYARSEPFDVSGLSEEGPHERMLRLDEPPEGVAFSRQSVLATLFIGRKLSIRDFEDVRVEVIGAPRADVRPATVHVKVVGPPERVEGIRKEALLPHVDPATANADLSQPGSAMLPVVVQISGVQVEVDPPEVLVKW